MLLCWHLIITNLSVLSDPQEYLNSLMFVGLWSTLDTAAEVHGGTLQCYHLFEICWFDCNLMYGGGSNTQYSTSSGFALTKGTKANTLLWQKTPLYWFHLQLAAAFAADLSGDWSVMTTPPLWFQRLHCIVVIISVITSLVMHNIIIINVDDNLMITMTLMILMMTLFCERGRKNWGRGLRR